MANYDQLIKQYISYWEHITPDSVHRIKAIADPEFRFQDPFNDVQGYDMFMKVIHDMFSKIDGARFKVHDHAYGQSGVVVYLRWDFVFESKGKRSVVTGMSEITINPKTEKVMSHIDHWDSGSQFYAKIPFVGFLIREVKKRMSV